MVGAPFACGGDKFTAAADDGGAPNDGSTIDGASGDAMAGDGSSVDAAPSPDGGVTIAGNVVDAYLVPLGGVDVHCQGQKVTSAADGSFTLAGITTPYTANIVVPQGAGRKHGYVFQGLTKRGPTLQLAREASQPIQTVALSGTVAANAPSSAGIIFADFPASTPATAAPTIAIGTGASTYSGKVFWEGASSANPTLYTLNWLLTSGTPTSFIGYASSSEMLSGGSAHTWNTPLSSTVGEGLMKVNVTPSVGYVPVDVGVFLRPHGANVAAPFHHGIMGTLQMVSVPTPDINNATFVACGLQVQNGFDGGSNAAFGYTCSTGLGKSDSPNLHPPTATTFVSPPSSAGFGTTFTYQSVPSAVYFVVFEPAAGGANADSLYVITAEAQTKIPDLGLLGFALPSGASFTAEVFGIAPLSGVDAAVGSAGYAERMNDYRLDIGPSSDGSLAYSGVATFSIQ